MGFLSRFAPSCPGAVLLLTAAVPAAIAALGSRAVERARLSRLRSVEVQRLEALRRLANEMFLTLDLDELLKTVAEELRLLAGAEAAAILLVEGDSLVRRATAGSEPGCAPRLPLWACEDVVARVAATGEPVYDLQPEAPGACSVVAVIPMRATGRTVGVIALLERRPRAISSDERTFLNAAASQAGGAIASAQLYIEEHSLREELHAVIEAMAEGVTVADPLGNIVLVNQAGRAILGLGPPARGPRTVAEYRALHLRLPGGEPLKESDWPINRALRGESFTGYEVVLTRADGTVRQAAFSGSPVLDESGRVALGVTVYHDITELRALERSREETLGLVSHDLRAPLAVIQGRAQMLARTATDGAARHVQAILVSARRMNAIIQDLVDLARLEGGQLSLNRRPVRLEAFVRELVGRLAPDADSSRFRISVPADLPEVPADPDRLDRILTNLLTNAVKYSEPGTPIVVKARARSADVVVSVADEGAGIPADELPHLFDRFYRARTGLHTEGVGLGLYIVKQLVEAHGGQIWAHSQPGEGSTFSFSLPLQPV